MLNLVVNEKNCRDIYIFKNIEELSKCVQCTISQSCNDIYMSWRDHLYVIPVGSDDIIYVDIGRYSLSKIIAIEYCITIQELYCAYESGDIASINITDPTNVDYKVVATFDDGLQCMKFSPDHELIAVVTGDGIVNTMVLDCQVMSEVILNFYQILFDTFIMHLASIYFFQCHYNPSRVSVPWRKVILYGIWLLPCFLTFAIIVGNNFKSLV